VNGKKHNQNGELNSKLNNEGTDKQMEHSESKIVFYSWEKSRLYKGTKAPSGQQACELLCINGKEEFLLCVFLYEQKSKQGGDSRHKGLVFKSRR
jgi:hypothetical protein